MVTEDPVEPSDPTAPTDPLVIAPDTATENTFQIPYPNFLLSDFDNVFSTDNLFPTVTLANSGEEVIVTQTPGTIAWIVTLDLAPDTETGIDIVWQENFDNRVLKLTGQSEDLRLRSNGTIEQFNVGGFSVAGTDFDFDGDGIANTQERANGTDPFVDDTADPVISLRNGDSLLSAGNSTFLPGTADVIVPRISQSNAPVIDGLNVTEGTNRQLSGEWAAAVQSDTSGAPLSIANLMVDIDAEVAGPTPLRRWAAMHDGRYLYVLVTVDDNGQRQRDSGVALVDDDSLELFLDADNSKSSTYGDNDFHRIMPLIQADAGVSLIGVSSGDIAGPNSSTAPLTIDFATGPGIGPDGLRQANNEQDVYELRIDLESAGISSDAPFGFELQINDDDDGLQRDSKWGWKHPARLTVDVDNTRNNPSLMGTLVLE